MVGKPTFRLACSVTRLVLAGALLAAPPPRLRESWVSSLLKHKNVRELRVDPSKKGVADAGQASKHAKAEPAIPDRP